jgi:hypothetical protein
MSNSNSMAVLNWLEDVIATVALITRPSFSEPRMLADQFQRNGVILGRRNGDTNAVSRGGSASACTREVAAMKTISAPRSGVDAADRAERGFGPFATLAAPIYPRHPYLPKGAKGPGADAQPVSRSTDDPTVQ